MLRQFDDVVATLELALNDLHATHALLAHCHDGANSTLVAGNELIAGDSTANQPVGSNAAGPTEVSAVRIATAHDAELAESVLWLTESRQRAAAMSVKLVEWRRVVTSHQSASRVLKWTANQVDST